MRATTLEQSKKLVKLGIDISTADMCWCNSSVKGVNYTDNYALHPHTVQELKSVFDEAFTCWDKYWKLIPAWSLEALLELIPCAYLWKNKDNLWNCCKSSGNPIINSGWFNNPLNACVETILKLHEQNIL